MVEAEQHGPTILRPRGYGYGVTVGVPKATWHPEVRALPLQDFPLTTFGVMWQGRRSAVLDAMICNEDMTGKDGFTIRALPRDGLVALLKQAGRL